MSSSRSTPTFDILSNRGSRRRVRRLWFCRLEAEGRQQARCDIGQPDKLIVIHRLAVADLDVQLLAPDNQRSRIRNQCLVPLTQLPTNLSRKCDNQIAA